MAKDTGRDAIPDDERDIEGEGEVDVLFRTQMAITNFLLGYWKHLLGLTAVLLAVVYGYSSMLESTRIEQRVQQAEMARVALEVPEPDPLFRMGLGPMDDPNDEERIQALRTSALSYQKVAEGGSGTGQVMAWIEAAETWTRAGEPDKAAAAYDAAHALQAPGILGWTAAAGVAVNKANAGDVEGAAAIFRQFADTSEGYVAERALFELGMLYEAHAKVSESQAAYQEFGEKYPTSELAPRVAEAARRVRDAG